MLPISWDTVRLFLHVLGATIWVGGQITLGALTPVLRGSGRDLLRAVARRFGAVAWPAFALLVATGVWNLLAVPAGGGAYRTTLTVKLAAVAASGLTAFLHTRARTPAGLAAFGGLSALTALLALFLGIMLG